jgi:hypothetical protein
MTIAVVPFLFIIICLILTGAALGKPLGWVIILLAVVALLWQLVGPRL